MIKKLLFRSSLLSLMAAVGVVTAQQHDFWPEDDNDYYAMEHEGYGFAVKDKNVSTKKSKKSTKKTQSKTVFEGSGKRHEAWMSKRRIAAEKAEQERKERVSHAEQTYLRRQQLDEERGVRIDGERALNVELMRHWRAHRKEQVLEETNAGAYADLYRSPMRDTYALYVSKTTLFNVTGSVSYATDSYGSEGTNGDITRLAFGESPIRLQDVLLASKLVSCGKVTPEEPNFFGTANPQAPQYLNILADERIHFLGQAESWGISFDFTRYLWKRHLAAGVQIPVIYKKHRLRAFMDCDVLKKRFTQPLAQNGLFELRTDVSGGGVQRSPAFIQRYGQNTDKFLEDVFKSKGFDELGGSTTGFGDITFFIHAVIDSNRVDNLMVGLRFVVPTAQKMAMNRLWAPELGNGGVFEGAAWMSMVVHKHSYFNPHLFIQGNLSSSNHVQRRVPRRVKATNLTPNDEFLSDLGIDIPFAERIKLPTGQSFEEFDTCYPNLGDHVANLKRARGPEFTVHIGNIFEQFPLRRSFIDVYYDLRAKFRDDVSCLDAEDWKPNVFQQCTAQIEHKAGLEWSYQFDLGSRWRLGGEYTFAGQNVAKTYRFHMSMNYSF